MFKKDKYISAFQNKSCYQPGSKKQEESSSSFKKWCRHRKQRQASDLFTYMSKKWLGVRRKGISAYSSLHFPLQLQP